MVCVTGLEHKQVAFIMFTYIFSYVFPDVLVAQEGLCFMHDADDCSDTPVFDTCNSICDDDRHSQSCPSGSYENSVFSLELFSYHFFCGVTKLSSPFIVLVAKMKQALKVVASAANSTMVGFLLRCMKLNVILLSLHIPNAAHG